MWVENFFHFSVAYFSLLCYVPKRMVFANRVTYIRIVNPCVRSTANKLCDGKIILFLDPTQDKTASLHRQKWCAAISAELIALVSLYSIKCLHLPITLPCFCCKPTPFLCNSLLTVSMVLKRSQNLECSLKKELY